MSNAMRGAKSWVGTVAALPQLPVPQLYVWGWNGADAFVTSLKFPNAFVERKLGETCDQMRNRCRLDAKVCDPRAAYNTAEYVYGKSEFGT